MPDGIDIERRFVAVMALDVAGYSRLMGLDEAGTFARMRDKMRGLVATLVAEAGGTIVKGTGDGAIATFPDAAAAVRCAAGLQRANEAAELTQPGDRRMRFRIGLSLSDVIVQDGDVFGEGVNIASRLEATADVGGVHVSEAIAAGAAETGLVLLDLGFRSFKNIARPVRTYKLAGNGKAGAGASGAGATLVEGFGERPAIAVLPFRGEDDAFTDGLTEEVITGLSRWRTFPVISRASVFAFKGADHDLRFIGQQLGARYVNEGSVKKAGARVRSTFELRDVETMDTLVSEVAEAEGEDVLAMQDGIVRAIIGAVEPELLRHERNRAVRQPQPILSAYDALQRGLWHHHRYTSDDNTVAQSLLREALALDPGYSQAAAALSVALSHAAQAGWADDPATTRAVALGVAQEAVRMDGRNPQARFALGTACMHLQRTEIAIAEFQRAILLHPSHAAAHANLASCFNYLDRAAEARPAVQLAMRLSPHDPRRFIWLPALAGAHYLAGDDIAALRTGQEALTANPGYRPVLRYMVAALGRLGHEQAAAAVLPMLERLDGGLQSTEAHLRRYFVPSAADRIVDGLRRAGLH